MDFFMNILIILEGRRVLEIIELKVFKVERF